MPSSAAPLASDVFIVTEPVPSTIPSRTSLSNQPENAAKSVVVLMKTQSTISSM